MTINLKKNTEIFAFLTKYMVIVGCYKLDTYKMINYIKSYLLRKNVNFDINILNIIYG